MSSTQLTPVSYLVLGLVDRSPGSTAYDLKQKVASSLGYFWSFSHSQIYAEAAGLAAAGLLAEEQEDGGRRRRRYTITDEGRSALDDWLAEPTEVQPEVRDLGLLKLFFADRADLSAAAALARAQEEGHRARLARYEEIGREIPADHEHPLAAATLKMGLLLEEAFIRFWREVRSSQG